jgi:hypothetical protein
VPSAIKGIRKPCCAVILGLPASGKRLFLGFECVALCNEIFDGNSHGLCLFFKRSFDSVQRVSNDFLGDFSVINRR